MSAVLVLLLLCLPQAGGPRTVERAIEDGVAYLRGVGEGELRERNATPGPGIPVPEPSRAGERALLAYTLLKGGVQPTDELVRRLIAELAFERIQNTYDIACTLLLLEEHDARAHRAWIEELARQLTDTQEEGDWGYPSGADLSNTQVATLGLWAASRAGVMLPAEVWSALAGAVERYQRPGGGFSYQPHGKSTGSMTAAGIATLALCEMELARLGALEPGLGATLRAQRREGLDWLGGAFRVERNPMSDSYYVHYWLYGLERMATFCGLARVGDHDWYAEGEQWLLDTQQPSGNWRGPVETCFAILFLGRAALSTVAPISGRAAYEQGRASSSAAVRIEVHPVEDGVALRVLGFGRQAAAPLEWPEEAGRGPRVLRVEYREGNRVLAVALGDETTPARGHTFPAAARLARGTHRIRACVRVLVPSTGAGSSRIDARATATLESPEVEVDVLQGLAPEPDGARPGTPIALGPGAGATDVQARASSVLQGLDVLPGVELDASRAVDGKHRTPWLAREDDSAPEITLSFRHAVRVDGVAIVPATLPGFPPDELGRALEVELALNGKPSRRVLLPPEPWLRATVALDEPVDVRSLRIRILARVPGRRTNAVGLGEIELFAARR